MVRTKYEDTPTEIIPYTGKILMYITPGWNVLFPVVDIIRLFKENSVVAFKYGKGQNIITTYGRQYNHRITGYEIQNKKQYTEAMRMVKCVFIFTDKADHVAETFITLAKSLKIMVVCYSNLDKVYHFYTDGSKISFKTPKEVIDKMYEIFDSIEATRYAELFPDFEIIEAPEIPKKETVLEECLRKLKKVYVQEENSKTTTKKILKRGEKLPITQNEEPVNIFSKFK
jgi:hypothetical protein